MTPRVLIIAGSDSGGGAGIQADIKTVTMLGGHAMTAITAITAQNTLGVEAVLTLPAQLVVQQAAAIIEDIGADAIKIGMIGNADIAAALVRELRSGLYPPSIVLDPVMIATSGACLADERTIESLHDLARMSAVVTPNLPELAVLCRRDVIEPTDVEAEAADYAARIGAAVLVKGGHGEGDLIVDRLVLPNGEVRRWTHVRIDTTSTHGTGCTLASGVATGLARGVPLEDAIDRAIAFVRAALANAPGLGGGYGPMGHALGVIPFDEIKG
jgi:hydroxymethylpyrimidine/phosphomethylpyrimidine kinase